LQPGGVQAMIICANRIQSLKYQRSTTLECKNIEIKNIYFHGVTSSFLFKYDKIIEM